MSGEIYIIYSALALLLVSGFGLAYCIIVYAFLDKRIARGAALNTEVQEPVPETVLDDAPIEIAEESIAPTPTYTPEITRTYMVGNVSVDDQLANLDDLKRRGFISDADYDIKRRQILG